MRPRWRPVPLDHSRGVSPRQLASFRPERKRPTSPTNAKSAVAVSRPTPGSCEGEAEARSNELFELLLDRTNPGLELADLPRRLEQRLSQKIRHTGARIAQRCLALLHRLHRNRGDRAAC